MKQRKSERSDVPFIPTRSRERFSPGEVGLIIEWYQARRKAKAIAAAILEKFGIKRELRSIYSKIHQLKTKGLPRNLDTKNSEINKSYEEPDNITSAIAQIDITISILSGIKTYLLKSKQFESKSLDMLKKMKKIKSLFESEETVGSEESNSNRVAVLQN